MTDTCENCRYYLAIRTGCKEDGICRFSPPLASLTSEETLGAWPRVKGKDWCGKHTLKAEIKP